jgi:hypothetical protein
MKRFISLALVAVVAMALGFSGAAAKTYTQVLRIPSKMAGTDSAFVSLPSSAIPAFQGGSSADPDTSAWIKIGDYNLAQCSFDNQFQAVAYLSIKATAPVVATSDSIGIVVQYSLDENKSTVFQKAPVYKPFTAEGTAAIVVFQCDTDVADPVQGAKWVRILVGDGDVSRTAPMENVVTRIGMALAPN